MLSQGTPPARSIAGPPVSRSIYHGCCRVILYKKGKRPVFGLSDNRNMKGKRYYQEYVPGQPLSTFFKENKIPLLQMRHLRDLDFPITRGISYERTVDEFLLQMAVNDVLMPLRQRQEMVILLDRQGALVREEGSWHLLFTPEEGERLTLKEDAPLYPILKALTEKEKKGEVSRVDVPERSMKILTGGMKPFCILDEYCKAQKGGYLAEAEKIVIAGPKELYRHVPVCRYNALSTVDKDEVENYHTIHLLMEDYLQRYASMQEGDNLRPLSIAVFGAPGAGKSFGVKQMALSMGNFSLSSLNISQYESPAELFKALHSALACKEGQIPLIFFDEFDAELSGTSRGWLKYFLAPMQDGEYAYEGRTHRIKAAVFVFAGATAYSFKTFLPGNPDEETAFKMVKGPDFVSRLQGILNIKGPNPAARGDQSHIIRRAMLMREQVIRKGTGIYDPNSGIVNVSRGMLSALLSVSEYRHGSRSLEFILDMSRLSEVGRFTPSCLPMDEQLDIHLDVDDFRKRLAFEQMLGDFLDKYAAAAYAGLLDEKVAEAVKLQADEEEIAALKDEAEKKKRLPVPEDMRRECLSQLYYIGVHLQDYSQAIGIRPILPGAQDAITELYGPALESLAELEHERWVLEMEIDGWHAGPDDAEAMTTPYMVPYPDLEEPAREPIRLSVRRMPENLRQIGFEFYRRSF